MTGRSPGMLGTSLPRGFVGTKDAQHCQGVIWGPPEQFLPLQSPLTFLAVRAYQITSVGFAMNGAAPLPLFQGFFGRSCHSFSKGFNRAGLSPAAEGTGRRGWSSCPVPQAGEGPMAAWINNPCVSRPCLLKVVHGKKIRTVPYLYLELNEVKLSQPTGAGVVIQRHGLAWRDLQAVFIPNNKKKRVKPNPLISSNLHIHGSYFQPARREKKKISVGVTKRLFD